MTKLLQRWTVNRQMRYEGGFQGRTNKLVDGCYSFWQGGALPLIHMVLAQGKYIGFRIFKDYLLSVDLCTCTLTYFNMNLRSNVPVKHISFDCRTQ